MRFVVSWILHICLWRAPWLHACGMNKGTPWGVIISNVRSVNTVLGVRLKVVLKAGPFLFHCTNCFLVLVCRGRVWRLFGAFPTNFCNAIIESGMCKDNWSCLLNSCCQCYLVNYLCTLFEHWSSLVSGGISDEHRSMEAPDSNFPHYQWAETQMQCCLSAFHKVYYYLLLSHARLTPPHIALVRASKTDLSSAHSAWMSKWLCSQL